MRAEASGRADIREFQRLVTYFAHRVEDANGEISVTVRLQLQDLIRFLVVCAIRMATVNPVDVF